MTVHAEFSFEINVGLLHKMFHNARKFLSVYERIFEASIVQMCVFLVTCIFVVKQVSSCLNVYI